MSWGNFSELTPIFKTVFNSNIKVPREVRFRVSSLPFCSLNNYYESKTTNHLDSYAKSFYTAVGTAVHEVLQTYFANQKGIDIFSPWKCMEEFSSVTSKNIKTTKTCNYITPVGFASKILKNHKCPHKKPNCTSKLKYEEITYNLNKLSGHSDLVFKYKNRIYLVDFKTTSDALFSSSSVGKDFPAGTYREQILTYAYLLKKLYNIKVDYVCIVYISRNKVFGSLKSNGRQTLKVSSLSMNGKPVKQAHLLAKGPDREQFKIYQRPFDKALYNKVEKNLEKYESLNAYSEALLKQSNNKNIKNIIKTRPCKSEDDYNKIMGVRFKYDDCPLKFVCTKNKESAIKSILKEIK